MTKISHWIYALLLCMGIVLLYVVMRPTAINVDVETVEYRNFAIVVEEQGRTRAQDPFIVASPVSGRLLRPTLKKGDRVTSGQVLAEIAPPPENMRTASMIRANLSSAEAKLSAAEAALMEAETEYRRAQSENVRRAQLFEDSLIGQEEKDVYEYLVEEAQARLRRNEASVQSASADVELANSLLMGIDWDASEETQPVKSPSSGTVYQVFEESERIVQAGAPLFAITNGDAIEIVVDLLTQDAVRVNVGDSVVIQGWGGESDLDAVVAKKEPEAFTKVSALGVEEQRVNIIVELNEPEPRLGTGYRVEAAIKVWEGENILSIPGSAIFIRNNEWHAYVVSNDKAELRSLELGQQSREFAEIINGVEVGEQVVLYPSDLISEGVRVE